VEWRGNGVIVTEARLRTGEEKGGGKGTEEARGEGAPAENGNDEAAEDDDDAAEDDDVAAEDDDEAPEDDDEEGTNILLPTEEGAEERGVDVEEANDDVVDFTCRGRIVRLGTFSSRWDEALGFLVLEDRCHVCVACVLQ
jgi:hypothetical protein